MFECENGGMVKSRGINDRVNDSAESILGIVSTKIIPS